MSVQLLQAFFKISNGCSYNTFFIRAKGIAVPRFIVFVIVPIGISGTYFIEATY